MEKWELIEKILFSEREKFRRSYKCINKNIFIREETIRLGIIVNALENIRDILHRHIIKLTKEHKEQGLEDTIKDTHEEAAVSVIKTKLRGNARNLISDESTISQIISKLETHVKGESVEVLSAR